MIGEFAASVHGEYPGADVCCEPVDGVQEVLTCDSTAGSYLPVVGLYAVQLQDLRLMGGVKGMFNFETLRLRIVL